MLKVTITNEDGSKTSEHSINVSVEKCAGKFAVLSRILTGKQLSRVFLGDDSRKLAEQLGLDSSGYEQVVCARIADYWADYYKSETVDPGSGETGGNGGETCCGTVVPAGVRWEKADRGEPVTWTVRRTGIPVAAGVNYSQIREAYTRITGEISAASGIIFKELPDAIGDIHVSFKSIDGKGKILAQAYYPNNNPACGLCGDIRIDSAERWTFDDFYSAAFHEFLHAIGIPHAPTSGGKNLMEPYFTGLQVLGPWDLTELRSRYPKN